MGSVLTARCPKCKTQVSVEEGLAEKPVTCSSCQSTFVPVTVVAESNKRFEMGMYAAMLVIGIGLLVYAAMTGNLKPKADPTVPPPAAEEANPNP